MKRCPACQSTKIVKNQGKIFCKKCGYTHISEKVREKEVKKDLH